MEQRKYGLNIGYNNSRSQGRNWRIFALFAMLEPYIIVDSYMGRRWYAWN